MNKVYRVIWNESLGAWVAVSELSKSKTKSSKTRTIGSVIAAGLMLTFSAGAIAAGAPMTTCTPFDLGIFNSNSLFGQNIVCAWNTTNSTLVGNNITAAGNGVNLVAVGNNISTGGERSTVLGSEIIHSGRFTTVIGQNIKSRTEHSIVMGEDTTIDGGNYDISIGGNQNILNSQHTVALGNNINTSGSINSLAAGDDTTIINSRLATAVGDRASVTDSTASSAFGAGSSIKKADHSTAVGEGASVNKSNSSFAGGENASITGGYGNIAIGFTSTVSDTFGSTAIGYQSSVTGNVTGNYSRGMALGTQAKVTDSDRGTALGASASVTNSASASASGNNASVTDGIGSQALGNNANVTSSTRSSAMGNGAKITSSNDALAAGASADVATSERGTAVGFAATVDNSSNANAIGTGAKVVNSHAASAFGTNATVTNSKEATAIGRYSKVTDSAQSIVAGYMAQANLSAYSTALGYNANVKNATSSVALGTNAAVIDSNQASAFGVNSSITSSASGVAIGNNAKLNSAADGIAIGSVAKASAASTIALGNQAEASVFQSIALGSSAKASAADTVALGTGSIASGNSAIALGNKAQALGSNSISIGKGNIVSGNNSAAIGDPNNISGNNSSSLGNNNTIATNDTFVVGSNVTTTLDNSVFLGKDAAYTAKGASTDGIGAVTEPVTVGGTLTYGDFAGQTPVGVVSVGDDGKERRIQNMAAGLISETSTDAINGSQLYATNAKLGNVANTVVKNFGGNATLDADGNITYTNIGNTGKDNIHDAIQAATTKVAGDKGVTVSPSTNPDGSTTYTVAAKTDGVTLNVDPQSGNLMAVTSALTNNSNGSVSTPAAPNALATAGDVANAINNAGFTLTAQGNNGSLVKPGSTVDMKNSDGNLVISKSATDNAVNYDLAAVVKVGTTSPITIDGKAGTISGLTNTTFDPTATYTGGQAATQEQLSSASSQLNNTLTAKGMDYMGDSGKLVHRDLGTQVNVKGGATGTLTSGNIGVVADGTDTLNVQLAKDVNLGTDGSLTAGNTLVNNAGVTISNGTAGQPVTLTNTGLNNGGNTITNVAPGVNGTDAANVDQLKTAQAAATTKVDGTQGVSVSSKPNQDGSTTYTVAAKTDGVTTTINGNNQIAAVTAPINSAGGVANTTGNTNSLATAGDVINAVNSTGFTAKANGDSGQFIKSGDQVNFNNGNNIAITRNGSDFTIATVDKPTFSGATITNADSVAAGGTTNYITQGNASAVNGGDVYNAITNTEQQYTGDNSVIIKHKPSDVLTLKGGATTSTENNIQTVANTDGSIGIKLAKDVNLGTDGSLTAGNTLVNNAGVTISNGTAGQPVTLTNTGLNNGGNTITNVAPGVNGTDAANVDQLKTAQAAATTKVDGTQGVSVSSKPNQDGSTTYTVAAKTDGVTTQVDSNGNIAAVTTTYAPTTDGKVGAPVGNGNSLVTANTVADAINNSGWKLAADGTTGTELIKPSDTVTFKTDSSNLTVKRDGANITYDLAKDININSVQFNDGPKITNDGNNIKIGDKDGNATKITNVANGDVTSTSKDAINGSQLHAVSTATKNLIGGNATVNSDGTVTASNIGGTGANTIDDAIKTVKTTVKSTDNTIKVTANTANANDGTVFDISVDAQKLAESAQLPVVYTKADGTKVYKVGNSFFDNKEGTGTAIDATDVIASMQNADGTISPTTLANIKAGTKATDAVNVSQLKGAVDALGGGAAINTDGTIKAPTYNITNPANGTVTTANNVGDALKGLNDAVNSPLTFKGDSGEFNRNLGQTTTVKGGITDTAKLSDNNIGVVAKDGTLDIKLAKDIAVDSVKTGDTTVNTYGVSIVNADPNKVVSLTASGLNNGNNRITNVAAGQAGTDAVNKDQLDKAQAAATTKVTEGKNVTVSEQTNADGSKTYTVATKDDVNFNSVTAGSGANQVVLGNDGVKVGGNTYISDTGLNANDKKITNVANGDVTSTSKDAINGSQLHAVSTATKNLIGGNATVNSDGTVTASNIGGTGANTIDDAIKTVKTTVKSTDNTIKVTANTANANDGTVFDISVDAQKLAESAQLPVVYTKADGTKVYKVGNSFFDNKEGTGTAIDATDVIASMQNADGTISPTTLANIKAGTKATDAVNVSQLKGAVDALGGGAAINTDGTIKAPTYNITNPANGTVTTANNVGDALKGLNDAVNSPLTFKGDSGEFNRNLGQTTTVKGGITDTAKLSDNNIGVVAKDGTLDIKLAKDIAVDSVKTGDTTVNTYGVSIVNADPNKVVSLTASGLNNGNNRITNVAAGVDATDAVNVSQLKAVEATANQGWNLTTNGKADSKSNVKPGDTVDFANTDGNVKIENKGNNVIVNLNKDIDLTKDGSVTIGDTKVNNDGLTIAGGPSVTKSGIDAGDKKITNVAPGKISADSKDAINGSQLYTVQQAAVAAKTEVKAGDNVEVKKESGGNGQDIYTVSAKDTSASVTAGSDAITVNKADPKKVVTVDVTDYKVDLSQATKDNIQKGVDAKGIVDNKGLTFAGDNNSSTEVQKLGSTVNVNGDSNITTQASGNTVKVTLNPNVTVESLTATNSVNVGSGNAQVALTTNVGKDDVRELSVGSANAPTRITNVARGVNDTDAVNLSQLKDLGYNINTKIDKVEKEANAGIASAMAMETAPFIAGKWTYAVGAAYHGGEQAVGATLRKTADNGRWSLTGGVATGTEGDPSVRIGISGVID